MQHLTAELSDLYFSFAQQAPERIEMLPQSGSDRVYFRIYGEQDTTYIGTYNQHLKENEAFLYFSRHFKQAGVPVPEIFAVNETGDLYIQQDLGRESLLDQLEKYGQSEEVKALYRQSLSMLAKMQVAGHGELDYSQCLTAKNFGKQAILSDLLYFKYYFLDTLKLPYDKQVLLEEFDQLSDYLAKAQHRYFMFRDFQSRNIIVNNGQVYFIDYQGGMQGALQYDVASLLWQAKAALSNEWKEELLQHYITEADQLLNGQIDRELFVYQYNGYVLIRLLQVLGAYGFRGSFQRKAHFLTSIPFALENLRTFLQTRKVNISLPEFERILGLMTSEETIRAFRPIQANEHTLLVVEINSFSYRKGIPKDETPNGGGFAFDMRGILNPGRFDDYKTLSGKDKPVIDFLEQRTRMNAFLNSAWDVIDIAVENYLERDFEHLQINFGCTGGQHRSVYAAEQTARHLRNKYKVKVVLRHTNEANWLRTLPAS
jgi:aminoglycoside/choline kinase family phosphotransferase